MSKQMLELWENEWPDRPDGWFDSEARVRLLDVIERSSADSAQRNPPLEQGRDQLPKILRYYGSLPYADACNETVRVKAVLLTTAADEIERLHAAPQASAGSENPVAWQCTDDRYPYIKDIVATRQETVDAWRESGIAFVGLGPITRPAPSASVTIDELTATITKSIIEHERTLSGGIGTTSQGEANRAKRKATDVAVDVAALLVRKSPAPVNPPQTASIEALADSVVREMHSVLKTQWDRDCLRAKTLTALRAAQSQAVCAPKVPWKGSLSVDLRKGALAVNANGVTLIDEAGTCWAIVFPDKNGFYDHAATIAAALSRPQRTGE